MICIRFLTLLVIASSIVSRAGATPVTSPDGNIVADVSIVADRLTYMVTRGGTTVVESSPLGFTMNGNDLGAGVQIQSVASTQTDVSFPSRHGNHTTAHDHSNGVIFTVLHTATGEEYDVNMRVYDSGIAFRYELNEVGAKNITEESTGFAIPAGTKVFYQGGVDVYENVYNSADISAIGNGTNMGPPVVGELAGGGYVAITHSGPGEGFPNPYLTKLPGGRVLQNAYRKNGDNTFGASTGEPVRGPWNVVTTGSLNTLLNSDIVESVAPAPDPVIYPEGGTDWAQPGRSVWDWMSRFPGGITAENSKLESLWASRLGYEYNTIDEGWGNWNGGNPWPEVEDVVAYSNALDVKVLVWVRSLNIRSRGQRAEFFGKLRDAGVSGFKADFFDFGAVSPSSKERVRLVERILKEAAGYGLVVNLHGIGKPMGQYRTFPNLLNMEAVYGKESYPDAQTTVQIPLTRLLAGPSDYTPLGLQGSLQGGQSQAFEIATIVSMAGPLITLAERGDRIAESPFAPLIKGIPCLWDETKVLDGSDPAESFAVARRDGSTWYVSILNANASRDWTIDLSFLDPGKTYQAEIVRDGATAMEYQVVTAASMLEATTAASGGYVARIMLPDAEPIGSIPFETSFGTGRGRIFAKDGEVISTSSWATPLLEERLPDLLWSISGNGLQVSLDDTTAWSGGTSVKVAGDLDGTSLLQLFSTQVPITSFTHLGLAFKRGVAGVDPDCRVVLEFTDAPGTPELLNLPTTSSDGWEAVEFDLSTYAGRELSAINLEFGGAVPEPSYQLNLGKIAIYETPLPPTMAPTGLNAVGTVISGLDTLSTVLTWEPVGTEIRYYTITQRNPRTDELRWLGVSEDPSYPLKAGRIGEEAAVVFEVTATGLSGTVSAPLPIRIDLPVRPVLGATLTGTVIGTAGSYQNLGNTREKVFDGDVATFFDANIQNNAWVGIDLGADGESRVNAIRFHPREGWATRMPGGIFQGANQSDFSDAVVLATVAGEPEEGQYTLVAVNQPSTFRYLRYLSPAGSWGNIAEVTFYAPGTPGSPVKVKAGSNETSALIEWEPLASAVSYVIKRSSATGGPYTVVQEGVTGASFLDELRSGDATYYYVVSAITSEGVEGENSIEVEAVDRFKVWLSSMGLTPGAPLAGFEEDSDGDGRSNGIEYAIRATQDVQFRREGETMIQVEIRDDSLLDPRLFRSPDFLEWFEVPRAGAVAQAGVSEGFVKIAFQDPQMPAPERQFYQLAVSR